MAAEEGKNRHRHHHLCCLDSTAETLVTNYRAGSSPEELEKATHARSVGIAVSPIRGAHLVGLECRWESYPATSSLGPATSHFGQRAIRMAISNLPSQALPSDTERTNQQSQSAKYNFMSPLHINKHDYASLRHSGDLPGLARCGSCRRNPNVC